MDDMSPGGSSAHRDGVELTIRARLSNSARRQSRCFGEQVAAARRIVRPARSEGLADQARRTRFSAATRRALLLTLVNITNAPITRSACPSELQSFKTTNPCSINADPINSPIIAASDACASCGCFR